MAILENGSRMLPIHLKNSSIRNGLVTTRGDEMELKRQADRLIRKYGTRNPFKIAKELGYIVLHVPLTGIRGFHQYVKRCHIIYIDSALSGRDATFVCAHELGHALLHKNCNRIFMDTHTYLITNRYEMDADRFAVNLLFGDDELYDFLPHPIQVAADCMGVSVCLAEYRLGLISENSRISDI